MLQVAIDEGPLHGPRTGVGNAVEWLFDALAARSALETVPYLTSMRARVSPPTRRLPLPAAIAHRLWSRAGVPHMDRWLGHPDLVHGTNYVVPPTRCPRLVSVYDCWFLEHPDQAAPAVRRAADVLRRSTANGAHVVTSSHASAERAAVLLDTDRVHVVHLGPPPFDTERPTGGRFADIEHGFVLALGTIERRKNLTGLVAAFARLAARDPMIRLVLAGAPGDDAERVRNAVGDLPEAARQRVTLTGRVTADEKAWLLRAAGVLAYPSLDEGFGFPILEAQQHATPVVASRAGSIPEIAGSGALFVAADDVEGLADGLSSVVTEELVRRRLVEAGAANLERFSWSATAQAFHELYERIATS